VRHGDERQRGTVTARIERVVTSGIFSLDGEDFEVDNNVWLVGDDTEVLVVDAAHRAEPILAAIGGRRLLGVISTHGHNDHITAAVEVAAVEVAAGAVAGGQVPLYLHPDDLMLWDVVHLGVRPQSLADGQRLTVAGSPLQVLHTPGHSPGAVCLYLPELATVITGDTLFRGGPGATGRSFSSYPLIVESIRTRLFVLPEETLVLTGHGPSSTIGAEAAESANWPVPGT
jgi:glyoxylase-like metal-dependent hydrolase (beta-lactamase superfamily II)